MRMLVFLLPVLLATPPAPDATHTLATVTVRVDGLEGDDGQVVVALFEDAEGFPRDVGRAARTSSTAIQMNTATARFDDVPPGRYAIVAFHDADGDGAIKRNLLGMPREGVALSNGFQGRPRFDRATVTVGDGDAVFDLTVRYF